MIFVSALFISFYSLLLLLFSLIWILRKEKELDLNYRNSKGFSVVVVVRNEANNISRLLESICNQKNVLFELILVDDASEDETIALASKYLSKIDMKILTLEASERNGSPKKSAITKAINQLKYDLVFCTDGDCVLSENLLNYYSQIFEDNTVKFISGPVTFLEDNQGFWSKIWSKIQIVEFASLVSSAAISIFVGKPNMCSGANIAYRKEVFYDVNGFDGNTHLASGDDEFLMHKIHNRYAGSIYFAKTAETLVRTNSCLNLNSFYNQRKRWASKWTHYDAVAPKFLAIFIFMVNFFTIYLLFQGAYYFLALRFLFEFLFLAIFLKFLKKDNAIFFILIVQMLYPFYVVFFGLNSVFMRKTYSWKGRDLK